MLPTRRLTINIRMWIAGMIVLELGLTLEELTEIR